MPVAALFKPVSRIHRIQGDGKYGTIAERARMKIMRQWRVDSKAGYSGTGLPFAAYEGRRSGEGGG